MEPYYEAEGVTVYHGDALEVYGEFDDSAFGLLWLDPPYYKVKSEAWDNQWKTRADFLEWLGTHADEWKRILAPNGSLYVCASPQMAWHVEGVLRERFNIAARVTWEKRDKGGNGQHKKQSPEAFRAYFPDYEVVFFCEHYGADNIAKGEAGWEAKCDELRGFVFEPLRAYLDGEKLRAGFSTRQVAEEFQRKTGSRTVTGMAGHWFSSVQWTFPTLENYEWLRSIFNKSGGEFLRKDYEELRKDYEELRKDYEELRRPFNATETRPFTSVWHYQTVQAYEGKHPCEKPYAMVRDVVLTSSRDGMLCGDFFAGSGVFGRAARDLGRAVVLCDQDEEWAHKAAARAMGPPMLRLIEETPQPEQAAFHLT